MWDRELNIFYKRLYSKLDSKGKKLLKQSQRAWITERDYSVEFNAMLLDNLYRESGTMYGLIRAGETESMITLMVKESDIDA